MAKDRIGQGVGPYVSLWRAQHLAINLALIGQQSKHGAR